jgi:hypothetical protein
LIKAVCLGFSLLLLGGGSGFPPPTAYYRLADRQGSVATDSAPEPANGNIVNPKWAAGGGLTLGREMKAVIGHPAKLKFRNNFTLAARLRIRSTDLRQVVGAFPSGGLKVGLDEITFSSWDREWNVPYLLPENAWVHLAATLDSANQCRLFVNGKQIAVGNVRPWPTDPEQWTIGTWDGGDFFEGDIAEVAIWDRALTPSQVKAVAASLGLAKAPRPYTDSPAPLSATPASVKKLSTEIRDLALQPDQLPRYPMSALLGEGRVGQALHVRSYAERAKLEKWFADNIPTFDCPDPIWKRCYYYRWFVTRANYEEEDGIPGFYEGKRGSYHAHITYSAPHIMDEVRWLRDGRYAYGQAEILGKRREPDGRRMGFYTHWIPSTLWCIRTKRSLPLCFPPGRRIRNARFPVSSIPRGPTPITCWRRRGTTTQAWSSSPPGSGSTTTPARKPASTDPTTPPITMPTLALSPTHSANWAAKTKRGSSMRLPTE